MTELAPLAARAAQDGASVLIAPRLDLGRDRERLIAPLGATLEEIVAAALPALPPGRRDWVRASIGPDLVPHRLWPCVRPKSHVVVTIRVVPAGGSALRQVLMIAVAVAAMAIGQFWVGPALAGTFGLGASTWAAIGTATTMMAGTLLVNALVPATKPKSDKETPRYAISGQQNAIAPDAPVPLPLGDIRFAPPYAALPYTDDVGDHDQYFNAVFVVGVGHHEITELQIGDTPIERYQGVSVETRAGVVGDAPLSVITQQVYEDATQAQLSAADGPITRVSGGDAAAISFAFRFPAGLIEINSKGKRFAMTVRIGLRARLAGTQTWLDVGTLHVTRKTTRDFRVSHYWAAPTRGRYEIEITRLTPDYDDSDSVQAACHLAAIRTVRPEYPINMPAAAPLALIAVRVRASRQLQGMLDNLTARVRPLMMDWDASSGAWVWRATRNPASIARYLLQGSHTTYPLPDARIDLARLVEWHVYCAAKGLSYDNVITEEVKLRETLADVCAAGRARPAPSGDMWSVVIDRPIDVVSAMITPRNAREISWTPAYTRYPDAVRVSFLDRSNGFKKTERVVPWIGFVGTPQVTEQWDMPGVTDADQIWRAARRRMRELMARPHPFQAMQDVEHLVVAPGDRVLLAHSELADDAVAATVADARGVVLRLDAPVTMTEGHSYRLRLRDGSGALRVADLVTKPGESAFIELAAALDPPPGLGDLALVGRYGEEAIDCVVSRIEPGDDWSATLTLLPHAPEIDAETDADIPPPWDGRAGGAVSVALTPAAPRITSISSGYELSNPAAGVIATLAPASTETVPVASFDLRWRILGDATWTTFSGVSSQASFGAAPGAQIELQARAISYSGSSSVWSASSQYVVLAATQPGPVLASFSVDRIASGARRYAWTVPASGDPLNTVGVDIRAAAGVATDWASMSPVNAGLLIASPWDSGAVGDGLYTFAARATDFYGLAGDPLFVTIRAEMDFRTAGYWGASPTITRASTGVAQAVDGSWSSFVAGALRRTDRGAIIEPAATNSVRNCTLAGLATGTPGTTPTNWVFAALPTGLSRQIVATGTESGVPYFDLRIYGTATQTVAAKTLFYPEGTTQVAAAAGQTWSAGLFAYVVGGTAPANLGFDIIELNSSGAGLALSGGAALGASAPLGSVRLTQTRTLTNASTAYVNSRVRGDFVNGVAYDFTIRVGGWVDLQQGSTLTTPIVSSGSATTRAADAVSLTIPTGATQMRVTYDDGSTQTVVVVSGPYTIPTNLTRATIARLAIM